MKNILTPQQKDEIIQRSMPEEGEVNVKAAEDGVYYNAVIAQIVHGPIRQEYTHDGIHYITFDGGVRLGYIQQQNSEVDIEACTPKLRSDGSVIISRVKEQKFNEKDMEEAFQAGVQYGKGLTRGFGASPNFSLWLHNKYSQS